MTACPSDRYNVFFPQSNKCGGTMVYNSQYSFSMETILICSNVVLPALPDLRHPVGMCLLTI